MANKCEEAFIEKLAPTLHLSAQTGQSVWARVVFLFPGHQKIHNEAKSCKCSDLAMFLCTMQYLLSLKILSREKATL